MDGHTDYVAFNHVRLGSPMSRSAGMVAPVWIIDPQEGTWKSPTAVSRSPGAAPSRAASSAGEILRIEGNGDKTPYLTGEATAAAEAAQSGVFTLAA